MRHHPIVLTLALLFASPIAAAAELPPHIARAATDPARAADARLDPQRHGPEIVAFAGVARGAKVLDLLPGGGYWTALFSKAVGPRGHVYGVWARPYVRVDGPDLAKYQTLLASGDYPHVTAILDEATVVAAPEKVDLVFTAQNYHDYPLEFMGSVDPAVLDKAVFDALKPGGTYIVIDHVAEPGSGMRDSARLHRIDPAIVRAQVEAAGFRFVAASQVLANPDDDHRSLVFAPSIRGRTDQFVFKFRKPG